MTHTTERSLHSVNSHLPGSTEVVHDNIVVADIL